MARMHADSLKLFYEESRAAREGVDALLAQYRSNTTTVLTLATGAAAFFGFADSPKGLWFSLALLAYAVAVVIAVSLYWPTDWKVNVASQVQGEPGRGELLTPSKLMYDLGVGNQKMYQANADKVRGKSGIAARFNMLIVAAGLVVLLASVNTLLVEGEKSPEITRVQIVEE